MTFISYSQNLEDVTLWRILKHVEQGFYVNVGVNDPKFLSVTRAFLAPDSVIQDLVPDVHSQPWYRRYSTPMFFKTHDLTRPEYRPVVYLVRDGRSVMVSYFHHLRALNERGVDFLRTVQTGDGLITNQ